MSLKIKQFIRVLMSLGVALLFAWVIYGMFEGVDVPTVVRASAAAVNAVLVMVVSMRLLPAPAQGENS